MGSHPRGRLDTRQRYVYASAWTIAHFLLWAVLFVVAMIVVPYFMRRFESFNTELPGITIVVIDVSLLVGKYWYLAAFLGLVGLTLDWLILASFGKLGWMRLMIVGFLFALLPVLVGAVGFLGIWLPWSKLVEDVTAV